MKIKVGTSGFGIAQAKYTQLFSCVEVQHTFYQPPKISTLERWRAAARPDFEFVIKAWQLITHDARSPTYRRLKEKLTEGEREEAGYFRPTTIVKEAWETTLASAEALQARTILFQCPASFQPTKENIANLERFFSSIDRRVGSNDKRILSEPPAFAGGQAGTIGPPADAGGSDKTLDFAWEPRGDWDPKVVKNICEGLNLCHAVDPFAATSVTRDKLYFRLHGRNGWRYEYDEEELRELAAIGPSSEPELTSLTDNAGPYVFFNNARMTQDALRFQSLLDEAVPN